MAQLSYQLPHLRHPRRVHAVRGLIQDEQLGVAQQSVRDAQPLLHAQRVGAELAVGSAGQANLVQQPADCVRATRPGDALEEPQIVATR